MAHTTTVKVPALRARLVSVAFERLVHILAGRERISNLPATSYIRTVQVNMATECFELMVIDPSFEPLENLGDMPTVAAEIVAVKEASDGKTKTKPVRKLPRD